MRVNLLEGVILAAGFSSRFKFEDSSFKKFLLPLKKTIILNYVIAGMYSANIRKINIVVDDMIDKTQLIESCYAFGRDINYGFDNLNLNLIENKYSERENGYSFFLGINSVSSEDFVLSMADHVFSHNVYEILSKNYRKQDILLATDPMKIQGIYDLDDCTKVYGENNNIKQIGKKITPFNRLDMGAFIIKTKSIQKIADTIEKKSNKFGVSDIVISAIKLNLQVSYLDFPNTIWVDVDNDLEYEKLKNNFDLPNKSKPFNLEF